MTASPKSIRRGIDRAALERDEVRDAIRRAGHGAMLLPDDVVAASLTETLAARPPGRDVWVFAYGSLIWSPMIRFAERRVVRVHGFHRGLYIWSHINRGTPDAPGIALGLDRGGSCQGVAYRLDEQDLCSELALLWRREMIVGSYVPTWVQAVAGADRVPAIAFVVNRAQFTYAGRLDDATLESVARVAHGQYGSCRQYIVETASSLEHHGIPDRRLTRLARRLADTAESPARDGAVAASLS